MAFNLGAFAGGLAGGMDAAEQNAYRQALSALERQRLQEAQAGQLGNQAYVNTLIPGGAPIGQQQPQTPSIPRQVFDATLGQQGLGLFGSPAPVQQQPQMPAQQPPQAPQQPQPQMPAQQTPQPSMQGGLEGATPQQIAAAINQANPGLMQRNPAAFAAAVQRAIELSQSGQMQRAQLSHLGAQTGELGARGEYERAHAQYMRDRLQAQGVVNKAATEGFKQSEAMLRNLENQKAKIETAIMPVNQKQAALADINARIVAYSRRRDDFANQLMGEKAETKTPGANVAKTKAIEYSFKPDLMSAIKKAPYDQLSAFVKKKKAEGFSDQEMRALLIQFHKAGVSDADMSKLVTDSGLQ